jgi:hypothetical protein
MSSVIISGDTSGAITVAAPAVAGTTTLTLPATTGTVLADTTVGVCRAWVNFNGTGTPAISASFNVTNITDNGTGNYTVDFTTAMTDANYGVAISINSGQISGNQAVGAIYSASGLGSAATLKSTTQLRVSAQASSPTFAAIDVSNFNVVIFR